MSNTFKLGRIGGIQIGIHYTWIFAFALITWSLAVGFFPANFRGWSTATYWIAGAISALLLFVAVLVHELSHSFVALARGQEVDSITLFIFGGVSNLKAEAKRPKDEFLVAVVGPLTSIILAGVFWAIHQALSPGDTPLGGVLLYLAYINLALGIFNLLPGFPLDGGRVLRAIVWGVSGSLRKATNVASYVGQAFGLLLIFWGVSQLFGGNFLGGLWIAFIGWFLNNAAEATRQSQVVKEQLGGVPVSTLMNPQPPLASPRLLVSEFVFDHVLRHGERALLLAEDGQLAGLVSVSDVKKVPREAWASTPVAQIMTPIPLKSVPPEADLSDALRLLAEGNHHQLPVVENGRVVGLLTRADVIRFLQLRDELHIERVPPTGAPRMHERSDGRPAVPGGIEATHR